MRDGDEVVTGQTLIRLDLGVDATVVRLIWCALGLLWGYGILLYIFAAILVPLDGSSDTMAAVESEVDSVPRKSKRKTSRAHGRASSAPAGA